MSTKKNNTLSTLKIEQWDVKLPIGNWDGPEALPLFPKFKPTEDLTKNPLEFREQHIQYHTNLEQHPKIMDWVNSNIPDDMKWLFHGYDVNHIQFQKIFFAHPSVYLSSLNDDWDNQLDSYRLDFIMYLKEIKCSFQFVTENEALDNGMLVMKDYERPRIIGSSDISPGLSKPPKKLWRYLTLGKFKDMLENKTVWFSRPQFFDDPHEFTMDESSQRELFQWKLDSFAREYNRAVTSKRESFVIASKSMLTGLPIDKYGKIEKSLINLSDLSDVLLSSIKKDIQTWQESFCISCWRYSPYDSIAIWNQYATLEEGIAIVVDLESIRKSLKIFGDIRLSLIEYRDFSDITSNPMNTNPLGYKDIRYAAEEEARFYFRAALGNLKGFSVPFDFLEVVKEIHLSPNATEDFKDTIQDLLNKHKLDIPLIESSLCKVPNKF